MSASIQTVSFQREAVLSSLSEGPPWTVNGVALGAGDVTVGQSGIKKVWPAEELKKAAESLQNTDLVVDHNNDSHGVVGKVTKAGYKDGVGVIYEAELFDEDLAQKINNGLLEVSIRGYHTDVDAMEENEEGAKVVTGIKFDNLSIVPTGAAPSNTLEMGEHAELSAAELAVFVSELQEIEPGMWVKGSGIRGITISAIEDGEVEVDIYEESDDKWRSTGETQMMSTSDLEEWDVDEEDIGEMKDESDEESDESDESDEEENAVTTGDNPTQDASKATNDEGKPEGVPTRYAFQNKDDAMSLVEEEEDLTGVHEMEGWWVPGATHDEFTEWLSDQRVSSDENSKHKMDEDVEDDKEAEGKGHSEITDGMMVQWQVNPEMFGKVVHVDNDEGKIMVEVMEMVDGKMVSTNHTVSAGFSDLVPMERESMADNISITVEEIEELADIEENYGRGEGEEEPITNDVDKKKLREQSPERFVDEEEELEGTVHKPSFSGKDSNEWNKPTLNDFTEESWEDLSDSEKSDIGDHFIFSMTGFPADNFSDMKLPVVRPSGTLSLNAVNNAKARLSQTDGLSSDQRDRVESMLDDMSGDDDEDEEENSAHGMRREERPRTIDDTGDEPGVKDGGPVDISLELINKYLRIEGHHERDSVDKMLSWLFGATDLPTETMADFRTASKRFLDETPGTDSYSGLKVEQFRDWLLMHGDRSAGQREMDEKQQRGELPPGFATPVHVLTGDDFWRRDKSRESELDNATTKVTNMTEDIEQKLAELNEPVAVEQSDLEDLQQKADRFEEMSETLASLKERTDILDSVDREQVEALSDADEPMVVESTRYEELEAEAEQVKMVYASALAEEMPGFEAEELADGFSIEALREKYEAQIGDLEDELSPEPKSGDVEEEELEERADEESEEELSSEEQEAEEMREQLRESIRAGL